MRLEPSFVRARRGGQHPDRPIVPLDPRLAIDGPLDPALEAIRSALQPHRRRLWLRRIVRRAWMALAIGAAFEALLNALPPNTSEYQTLKNVAEYAMEGRVRDRREHPKQTVVKRLGDFEENGQGDER